MVTTLEAVAAEAGSFGTDKVVITGMYRFDYGEEASVRALASRLNKAGKGLSEKGISLLYHNHNVELLRTGSGRRAYEILLEETDPAFLNFEFDSYWFTDGGADASAWMRRLGNRLKLWHVTDRGTRVKGASVTPILKVDSVELGTGNMDLEGLLAIAEEAGAEAAVLESHKNWIGNDPLASIELSADWLRKQVKA